MYFPGAAITHSGGQGGTGKKRLYATIEWHRAMWIFDHKHRAPQASFPERMLVYSGIAAETALAVAIGVVRDPPHPAPPSRSRSLTRGLDHPQALAPRVRTR